MRQPLFSGTLAAGKGKAVGYLLTKKKKHLELLSLVLLTPFPKVPRYVLEWPVP